MRGKVAKAIRKSVYGATGSHRARTYAKGHEPQAMKRNSFGRWIGNPVCICTGSRRTYQDAKNTKGLPF